MPHDSGPLFAWASRSMRSISYAPTATSLYELAKAWRRDGRRDEAREAMALAADEAVREEARADYAESLRHAVQVAA